MAEAVSDPIERARQRNEAYIAVIIMVIGTAAALTAAWRLVATESGGLLLFAFSMAIVGYYAVVYRTARSGRAPARWRVWVRSFGEVSAPAVGMLINLQTVDEVFALTSGTGYLFIFAVATSSLRLDPNLPLFVAVVGFVEQLAIYLWLRPEVDHLLTLSLPIFSFRLVLLLITGFLGSVLARTLRAETERASAEERVRAAFGSYVDRRVVDRVLRGDLQLAPERRIATVMFVDIRDFTRFAERRDPGELFRMLDGALDTFAMHVQREGGIVNKFLGDGLMALFGVPEEQPDHPRRAVRAALRIEESARLMAHDGRFPELRVGIGIHTGEVVAGDIGRTRREYTAIGDVVNVASRIEAANKELGTTILITGEVRDCLGSGATLVPKQPLVVRGRTRSIEVYEVRDLEGTVG